MRMPLVLLAAFGGVMLTQGCVLAGPTGAAMGMQDRTFGEAVDDSIASGSIKRRLMAVDRNGFGDVDIQMASGRLLMSGQVPTEEHKQTAELLARSTRGVHEVFNEVQVGAPDRIARNLQDDFISTQVRTRLTASPAVRSVNIDIQTHQGTVYLMGIARTQEELQHAAEITSNVSGVQRVVSLMEVRGASPAIGQAEAYPVGQQASSGSY
ncbi:MAG: BON domain-containing protein [Caulobacterales bacterium]